MEGPYQQPMGNPNEGPKRPEGPEGQPQNPTETETGTSGALRRQRTDAQRGTEGPTNPTAPEVQETEVQGIEGQGGTEGSGLSAEPRSSEGPRPSEGTGGSEGTNFQIDQSVPPESGGGAKPPLSDQLKRLRPLFAWANTLRKGSVWGRLKARWEVMFGEPFVVGSQILVPRSAASGGRIEGWTVTSYKGLPLVPWSRRVILAHPNGQEYGTKEIPLDFLVAFNLVMTELYAKHMNGGVTLPNGEEGDVIGYQYHHESRIISAWVMLHRREGSKIVVVPVQRFEI